MSGGHFEGSFYIYDIAEHIESLIEKNGKPEEDGYVYKFSDETIAKFRYAAKILKEAATYTHRIDYLISGDDGEETFHKRLVEDLKGHE